MLELAISLRDMLASEQCRLVLVESCTAGRVAATLGELPGISQWLCGSLVVYRNASKSAWLGVPDSLLDDPQQGPVSAAASRWLARAALERTPEANLAVAVTGDIGPHAPPATDGCIFLAAAIRVGPSRKPVSDSPAADAFEISEQQLRLVAPAPRDNSDIAARQMRLEEATRATLSFAVARTIRLTS
ncbi:MAG: CinA family protein [Pirellulaceae bacterium]